MNAQNKDSGFTLIELSIVLVIIGLIVGGVVVAQDLIKAAKERAVSSEMTKYETAVNTFRLKYNCLPGDCNNAYTFFGSDCAASATLCNGNGDKFIGGNALSGVSNQESYRTPQHLTLAGLVEGSYSGVTATPVIPGAHVLPTDYADSLGYWPYPFEFDDLFIMGYVHGGYSGPVANTLLLAGINGNNSPYWHFLTPTDALRLDRKIDDGLPGKGRIIATRAGNACSTSTNPNTAAYNTAITYVNCAIGLRY